MQKAFSLQPDEQRQASQLEDEQRTLLAQFGSIELQRKAIRKRLPQIEEQQRTLVRNVVQRVGVTQFTAARLEQGNLLVDIPNAPEIQVEEQQPLGKTNGMPAGVVNQVP
jgi:hypothetical protein